MTSLKEFAKTYESPQLMGNIADLEVVRTDVEIKEETRKNREGEDYHVSYITVEDKEYRIPATVIEQLKAILQAKSDLTTFKVSKTGTGMGTKYQVISL